MNILELKSKFSIARCTEEYLYIIDCGGDTRTVTNDADNIVRFLSESYNLGNRRLIYRDSLGEIDEIIHENGQFKGFSCGYKGIVEDLTLFD